MASVAASAPRSSVFIGRFMPAFRANALKIIIFLQLFPAWGGVITPMADRGTYPPALADLVRAAYPVRWAGC
jgi:hypothetical protein